MASTNCKPFFGDLELLCIVPNEVLGGIVGAKRITRGKTVSWAMDSEVIVGTVDSGFTHPWECLEDRVEMLLEHVNIRADIVQDNIDDYIPEAWLKRPEESVVVCHGGVGVWFAQIQFYDGLQGQKRNPLVGRPAIL